MKSEQKSIRTAVVTASYSGLGFQLCRLLLQDGFQLLCLDRDVGKNAEAKQKLQTEFPDAKIEFIQTDMASPASIAAAAQQVSSKVDQVEMLFHVAGAATATKQFSPQENELHFEVNTLGPILLTNGLRSVLAEHGNAVVVTVGSSAMKMAKTLNVSELVSPKKFKKMSGPYAQSKLAVTTAMVAMAPSFDVDGISLRIVDPGPCKTNMSSGDAVPRFVRFIRRWFSSPQVGAQKIYAAAVAKKFTGQTGVYIERGTVAKPPKAVTDKVIQAALLSLIQACLKVNSAGQN